MSKRIREAKFRALIKWPNLEADWVYYHPLEIPYAFYAQNDLEKHKRAKIIVKDLEFTGRQDKLHRDLYEGDIVKFNHYSEHGNSGKMIGEIYFDYQELAWAIYSENNEVGMGTKKGLYLGWAKNIELLGDKYRNPELQEKY